MSHSDNHLDFHRPNQKDKKLLSELNSRFQPYADTAYGTLLTWWNLYNDLEIAYLNGNAIVRSSYPSDGDRRAYTIIGGYQPRETVAEVFRYLSKYNEEIRLDSIPKYIADDLANEPGYTITNNLDVAEYILSAEKQSQLVGSDFLKLRHKVNAFINKYGHASLQEMDITENRDLILNSLDSWRSPATNDRSNQERQIIKKSLAIHKDIEMHCIGAFINNQLIGVTLYKILPQGYANINHVKVNYEYMDIFIYKLYSIAQYLRNQGVEYLNIEQDLGIEGLRTFKQRLRPVKMLEKYVVTQNLAQE